MTERSGKKWTPREDEDVYRQFIRGLFPSDIAALQQRSELAIQSRLAKIGLLSPMDQKDIERVKSYAHKVGEEIFIKVREFSKSHPSLPIGDVFSEFHTIPLKMFDRLYYICPLENIPSISERGILSWSEMEMHGISHVDISLPEAQAMRARQEPVFRRSVHDYVPLYINPKNPMLYLRKDLRDRLAILHVSLNAITGNDHLFSDGNAAAARTNFSICSSIMGSCMEALFAEWWPNVADGKRRRCAEVLVYMTVPSCLIIGATCYSQESLATCLQHLKGAECVIDRDAFF